MLVVGVDWGSEWHSVCVQDRGGDTLLEQEFPHSAAGLESLSSRLQALRGKGPVLIGVETPRGPLIDALRERGFSMYSVNPTQVDAHRRTRSASGAKDDRRDAEAIAHLLRTQPDAFRPVTKPDPIAERMRSILSIRATVSSNRVAEMNRLRTALTASLPTTLGLIELSTVWGRRVVAALVRKEEPWKVDPRTLKARMKRARKVDVGELRVEQQAKFFAQVRHPFLFPGEKLTGFWFEVFGCYQAALHQFVVEPIDR